jgi:hypothetical protein
MCVPGAAVGVDGAGATCAGADCCAEFGLDVSELSRAQPVRKTVASMTEIAIRVIIIHGCTVLLLD